MRVQELLNPGDLSCQGCDIVHPMEQYDTDLWYIIVT